MLFTFGGVLLGHIGPHFHPLDMAVVWYGGAVISGMAFQIYRRRVRVGFQKILEQPFASLAVILTGTWEGVAWFFTLITAGLSTMSIAARFSVVLVVLAGLIFFKEHYTKRQLVMIGVMLVAGFIFIGGADISGNALGYGLAFVFMTGAAVFQIVKKTMAPHLDGMAPYIVRAFLIWLTMLVLNIFMKETPTSILDMPYWAIGGLMLGGTTNASLGQYFRMKAFSEGAYLGVVSMIFSFIPVVTFLYGIVILGEPGNMWKYTGAALILPASVIFALSLQKRKNAN